MIATYDYVSNRFLVTYSGQDFVMRVMSISLAGSVYPIFVPGGPTQYSWGIGIKSPHAPAVACNGSYGGTASGECILTYQTADANSTVGWSKFHMDTLSNKPVVDSTWVQGIWVYDTPSVVADTQFGIYRLAYTSFGSAIYSYSMPFDTGTTWTGTGDIFNNSSNFVSSPALSIRPGPVNFGDDNRTHAWFVKYW